MSTTAAALARWGMGPVSLPAEARRHLLMLVADTLAVGAAGSSAAGADAVLAVARAAGEGDDAPLLGRGDLRLPAAGAAFVNGFQVHALEWDAVHEGAVVHAMSVAVAALQALAARARAAPDTVLDALAVAVETACRLGVAARGPMRFFRPATAGLLGAALGGARLLGLRHPLDAVGLAYSQCAGTMQAHVEGSIALPFQIAVAARAAVTAVDAAAAGLSGPHDVLDGPFGWFRLFEEGDGATMFEGLGERWRLAEISVKPWPSGRASHATLGALQALGPRGRDVVAVEARVPPLVRRLVGRPWVDAMTPGYARLCLPFLVALQVAEGRIDPRRFTPQAFADPRLRALGAGVSLVDDRSRDPNALAPQAFRFTRADGGADEVVVPATPGHPDAALSPVQHRDKLMLALSLAADPAAMPSAGVDAFVARAAAMLAGAAR